MSISGVNSAIATIGPITSGENTPQKVGNQKSSDAINEFSNLIKDGVNKVSDSIKEYETMAGDFADGKNVSVHELVIKGEQADISLRLMSAVKTKVIDAYNEIMRMQV
ncbi:MAG: flagellar hook-basal body complex protein FliE [Deltaproteobacteria bacterium]|nr:flagellar hook-basal body complex protein FliE [Deltaproteobacteria bacterium]